jgi:hypothetical protein
MSLRDSVALAIARDADACQSNLLIATGCASKQLTSCHARWDRGADEILVTIGLLGESAIYCVASLLPQDLFDAAP